MIGFLITFTKKKTYELLRISPHNNINCESKQIIWWVILVRIKEDTKLPALLRSTNEVTVLFIANQDRDRLYLHSSLLSAFIYVFLKSYYWMHLPLLRLHRFYWLWKLWSMPGRRCNSAKIQFGSSSLTPSAPLMSIKEHTTAPTSVVLSDCTSRKH